MRRAVAPLVLTGLMIAQTAVAQNYGNPYELPCREELGLLGANLQPGPVKDSLRECIRDRAAAVRQAEANTMIRSTTTERQQTILDAVTEKQGVTHTTGSSATRILYETACREILGITKNQVVQAGPQRGSLERCIERKTSEASRAANMTRRRENVYEQRSALQQQILQSEQEKLQQKLNLIDEQKRARLQSQNKANPRQLRAVSKQQRSDAYYEQTRAGSDAAKRMSAEDCRSVPAAEWGACIRNALQ